MNHRRLSCPMFSHLCVKYCVKQAGASFNKRLCSRQPEQHPTHGWHSNCLHYLTSSYETSNEAGKWKNIDLFSIQIILQNQP